MPVLCEPPPSDLHQVSLVFVLIQCRGRNSIYVIKASALIEMADNLIDRQAGATGNKTLLKAAESLFCIRVMGQNIQQELHAEDP